MSEGWKSGRDPLRGFRILRVGLNAVTRAESAASLRRRPDPARQALYGRINARAARMFELGLVEETRQLIRKYGETPRAFGALGVAITGVIFFGALHGGYAHALELSLAQLAGLLVAVAALTRLLPGREPRDVVNVPLEAVGA